MPEKADSMAEKTLFRGMQDPRSVDERRRAPLWRVCPP